MSNLREIVAARMHNGHRRVAVFVFLHEQQCQRFANDHAAAEDHNVGAIDLDVAFQKQTLHAERCARHKTARVFEHELGDIFRVKSVHVFPRVQRTHNCRFVDLLRRRRLNKYAVNSRIAVEFFDARKQFSLRG
ncbi:MAG: hypothetical protein Udaeo_03760 [Candidatus Udaeobacter sp.]|nr:MAG: hypothetical protein Udaeo_03760 [Candidatus Udaeobacter sp.]